MSERVHREWKCGMCGMPFGADCDKSEFLCTYHCDHPCPYCAVMVPLED